VAARADDVSAMLGAVSRALLNLNAVTPGLKAGNIADKSGVVAALRSTLDAVSAGSRERGREVTVVIPDAAVRVLLLEFDELPSKPAEALPIVRFRLKKLLPFDADDAAVSYQVMSSEKGSVSVLAVAMPRDVLAEFEGVVTAAGYESGAVLSSTLASLAALDVSETAALVVNAGRAGVTTAIVKSGVLLLHRSLDMTVEADDSVPGSAEYSRLDANTATIQTSVLRAAEMRELIEDIEGEEVVQEVSVAAAYFEDTLQVSPRTVISAGPLGADRLAAMLEESGLEGLSVREMVDATVLEAGAMSASTPRGWLAGVRGALKG
jgi:type IV pilus assembly protein PilM